MLRLIRNILHMLAYRRSASHLLTSALRTIRKERALNTLLDQHASHDYKMIFFADENSFAIEGTINSKCQHIKRSKRSCSHAAASSLPGFSNGLVGSGISRGKKTVAKVCQPDVLNGVVKALNNSLFNGQQWTSQKVLAAHKPNQCKRGCKPICQTL